MSVYIENNIINTLEAVSKLNYGMHGICYKYEDKVLKIFTKNLEGYIRRNIKKNLNRKSDIILYPKDEVFIENKKNFMDGYICSLAKGLDLYTLKDKIIDDSYLFTFDDFLSIYYDNFLYKLNKENVLLEDVKPNHIFIDDSINLIDTDFYQDVPLMMTHKQRKKENLREVNDSLISIIQYFLPINFKYNSNFLEKEIFLYDNINYIRRITNYEVNSLNELKNYRFSDEKIDELKGLLIK